MFALTATPPESFLSDGTIPANHLAVSARGTLLDAGTRPCRTPRARVTSICAEREFHEQASSRPRRGVRRVQAGRGVRRYHPCLRRPLVPARQLSRNAVSPGAPEGVGASRRARS